MAHAGPIYGPLMGNTVIYDKIQEATSTGTPLFGVPSVAGDSIDFNPVGFNAHASGAGGIDLVDSNLTFTVKAKQDNNPIITLQFAEAGDTTLSGFGSDATFTSVTADGFIDIDQVDGVGVNVVNVPFTLTFTPFGGAYGLGSHGGGPIYHTTWIGGGLFSLNAALTAAHVPFHGGATHISVDMDNTLTALSENGTSSLIAKKDFGGVSITINPQPGGGPDTPEPGAIVLAAIGLVGLMAGRKLL